MRPIERMERVWYSEGAGKRFSDDVPHERLASCGMLKAKGLHSVPILGQRLDRLGTARAVRLENGNLLQAAFGIRRMLRFSRPKDTPPSLLRQSTTSDYRSLTAIVGFTPHNE